ncbi:MAG: histidine phosphatase family protein, partial [Pseudomonadota bacterium]
MAYPDLFILRHGESEWNREGRMQGHLDSPLTPKGEGQADRQGVLLGRLDLPADATFWVSPQPRARATADRALGAFAASAHVDPRLREIHLGDWDGMTRKAINAAAPGILDLGLMAWMDHAPGGEGLEGLRARVTDWLGALDGPAVVVTHGITSRMIRGTVLGLDVPGMEALPG